MLLRSLNPRQIAVGILLAAIATIGGALVFEHGFGLRPCKLCLIQRQPYYVAMAAALLTALAPGRWARLGLSALVLIFLVSAGLGAYHAGVEWGFFAGPNDCGGAPAPTAGNMGDFLNELQGTRVVSCTEAAWRFLGLSLAGWNVLISLALASLAALGTSGRYGSSSLSQ
jgi:disulfide bond formation protein DsbB